MSSFKNLARYSTVVTAAFSMTTAACDSDSASTTPESDTSTAGDTSAESDASGEDTATGGDTSSTADATPANPCEPNPCTTPPAATCDGDSVVTATGPGTCTAEGTAPSCAYETTTTACSGETPVCASGECVAAGNACEYEFDARVSYVTEIRLSKPPSATPPKEGEDDCCFDFTDDGVNDNALGKLLGLIGGIVADFDVNATIAEQISSGSLALLLETKNVSNIANATGITLNGFYGVDGDADLANNAAGTSTFKANVSSFKPSTAIPWISFSGVTIANGVLTAGPAPFNLSVPLLGATLDLRVDGTRLESPVSAGPNGADGGLAMGGDEGARLGGYVAIATVAEAFNQYLDASCSCIVKPDTSKPYIGTKIASGKVTLETNIGSAASCTDDICKQIGQYVPIAKSFITPDVDGDSDGILDSMSVGVRIKATSATMSGVMCEAEPQ